MAEHNDKIIADILGLEPSLKDQEKMIRSLVVSLQQAKPEIEPDQAFAKRLRLDLLTAAPGAQAIPSRFMDWFQYLAPLGAVALLIFMLIPEPLSQVTEEMPMIVPSTKSAVPEGGGGEGARSFMVPGAPASEPAVSGDMGVASDMAIESMMAPVASDYLVIPPQPVGNIVTISSAYFISPTLVVVSMMGDGMPGRIVGVSKPLMGDQAGTMVPLAVALEVGSMYVATLYLDTDADGIFTPSKDEAVFDQYGQPLSTTFFTIE